MNRWNRAIAVGLMAILMLLPGPANAAAPAPISKNDPGNPPVNWELADHKVSEAEEGFLGWPWGSRPEESAGLIPLADIAPGVSVSSSDADVTSLTGELRPLVAPRLVFLRDSGLVLVHIDFAYRDFGPLEKRLRELLGEPSPIIYEKRAAKVTFGEEVRWQTGKNTQIILKSSLQNTYLEISQGDFFLPGEDSFNTLLDTALLKRAEDFDVGNLAAEASSVYQILLNGSDGYSPFTPTAQEHLAAYSRQPAAAEYLSEDKDMRFFRLKNLFAHDGEPQWIRIELGADAQAELQSIRPPEADPAGGLTKISAVLCRVGIDGREGKYVVLEQIWLDGGNRIIGGRPAWAPQDTGWPVSYIREACGQFLTAWFSFHGVGQGHY